MTWKVEEYIAEDGRIPYRDWFDGLHVQAAAKVATAVLRMEMGNTSSVKWFDGIGEYRIDWGPGYRIYLMRDGDRLILLFTGGTKATQKKRHQAGAAVAGRVPGAQGPQGQGEVMRWH